MIPFESLSFYLEFTPFRETCNTLCLIDELLILITIIIYNYHHYDDDIITDYNNSHNPIKK